MHRRTAASATRFVLVLTACLIALILAAGWMVNRNIAASKSAAIDIANLVMNTIQVRPKVVVNHRTVVEQQSAVLQLVTVERKLTERQRIDDSWLQSTKTLEVEADFIVRAGFDLEKPFVIQVDHSGSALRVTLPPAEILTVDLSDVRFLRDEDGYWNKLTAEDREKALRDSRAQVESQARKSGLTQQARVLAEKRLTDLLTSGGRTVTFEPEKSK